jgi:hypothetical protein
VEDEPISADLNAHLSRIGPHFSWWAHRAIFCKRVIRKSPCRLIYDVDINAIDPGIFTKFNLNRSVFDSRAWSLEVQALRIYDKFKFFLTLLTAISKSPEKISTLNRSLGGDILNGKPEHFKGFFDLLFKVLFCENECLSGRINI